MRMELVAAKLQSIFQMQVLKAAASISIIAFVWMSLHLSQLFTIAWTSVDHVMWGHMALQGYNEFIV